MKLADLTTAQTISAGLAAIERERQALSNGVSNAGMRCRDMGGTWVNCDPAGILSFVLKGLEAREADLRRRAAQIGLSL